MTAQLGDPPQGPFVGVLPFDESTRAYFFGRDREALDLLNLLAAQRAVLFHAPSGAGKTSLIQAALVPELRRNRFAATPIIRVGMQEEQADRRPGFNRYLSSVLRSLSGTESGPREVARPESDFTGRLADLLARRAWIPDEAKRREEALAERVLIFDQFEEILTADPIDLAAKRAFFEQVGLALRELSLWALFAMREDYVAALEPYLLPLPNRLEGRFRIDLLDERAARLAVRRPIEVVRFSIEEQAVQNLVSDLCKVRRQSNAPGSPPGLTEEFGPFVEPFQLQVVCQRLWQSWRGQAPTSKTITEDDVRRLANVDGALRGYYADKIKAIARDDLDMERRIRSWIGTRLITPQGVRGIILKTSSMTEDLHNDVIQKLVDTYLVRGEQRRGETWYELVHDRLIEPIRADNTTFNGRLTLLQRRAFEWDQGKRPDALLLRRNELPGADQPSPEDRLTRVEIDFLKASRDARAREDRLLEERRSRPIRRPTEPGPSGISKRVVPSGSGLGTLPELELYFYRRGEAEFTVVLQLREPGQDAERRFEVDSVRIDVPRFATPVLLADPVRYGWELGTALFGSPAMREAFDGAINLAAAMMLPLRLRLCTDQRSRDDLNRLRWELLRRPHPEDPGNPDRAEWLIGRPTLWFSRHLFSGEMRPVRLRPKSDLTSLVVVANPTDLDRWQPGGRPLAPIDVEGELETARQGLRQIERKELVPGAGRVTMVRLLAALRDEPDIVYLVCHGAIVDGEPRLMLERDDGTAEMVSGSRLVEELDGLRNLPRLVVLCSPQSRGDEARAAGTTSALAAIGPRLAEAGVPAVLAMQGGLSTATARRFLPPFFAELLMSGRVDAAVSMGRAAVRDAPDAWMPMLTTRLAEGRMWFLSGLTVDRDDAFRAWNQLISQIKIGRCVPILGSGLLEPFIGSRHEVARRMADAYGYPMALGGREQLPEVAQFLKTMYDDNTTRLEVLKEMSEALRRRWPELNLPPADLGDPGADLQEKLRKAWREYQRSRPFEPHRYLASMRGIKTIVTTNPDDLLGEAMKDAGRTPRIIPCRWDGAADEPAAALPPSGHLEPTGESPDVFQLFGHLGDPYSVLVTEDDYFQFLTSVTRRQVQKRDVLRDDSWTDDLLRGTLATSALVFLGFRLTDWDFRSLFRVLIDQGGRNIRSRFTHVAVQIDPEDGTHNERERARAFIENLFGELVSTRQSGRIAVYWGSDEDFLQDLDRRWQTMQPAAMGPLNPRA